MNDDSEYELEFAHYMDEHGEEQEEKQKTRLAGRAFIQLVWFIISGAAAYFATQYLISESIINLNDFYRAGISESVPEWVFLGLIIFLIFMVFQLIFAFGYMIATPKGRQKAGGSQPKTKRRKKRR